MSPSSSEKPIDVSIALPARNAAAEQPEPSCSVITLSLSQITYSDKSIEDEWLANGLPRSRADSRRQLANFETNMMGDRTLTSGKRTQHAIRPRGRSPSRDVARCQAASRS